MNNQHTAKPERNCDSCDYSLAGLPMDSKCPECGHTPSTRSTTIRDATMSVQAPPKYIRWIRYGFVLCMISIMGGLAGPIIFRMGTGTTSMLFPVALTIFVLASGCWTAGIWMITRNRTGLGTITPDTVLDNVNLVRVIRLLSFAWPTWISLIVTASMSANIAANGGTAIASPMTFSILIAAVAMVAWIGLIPVSVYFAEMSYWASDDRLASRLRATTLVMVVFGIATAVSKLLMLTNLPLATPAASVYGWSVILSFGATLVLFYSIFRMTMLLNWVLSHQILSSERYDRINARIDNDLNRKGAHSSETACEHCGYNLKGLPKDGRCPECGELSQSPLLFPIRDPANDAPKHDGTALGVEESTHGKVTHPRPLGIPLEDVPDREIEGGDSIPLADE